MFASVLEEVYKQEQINRLRFKLDVAEAVNVAFVGSQHGKQNQVSYARWQRAVEREVAKLRDQQLTTVWDTPRKSMRLGR